MKDVFYEGVSEIHTVDGYHKNVILRNNNLIVPYINLAISEHALNPDKGLKYINYSYLVAVDVCYLSTWIKNEYDLNGKQYWIINKSRASEIYYWGGKNLDENSVYASMEICCKEAFLQIVPISRLSNQIWIPNHRSISISNTDWTVNENFFTGAYLTENIKDLIK